MRRVLVFAVLVPVMALMGVACGGDDADETLSADEFLEQGNAICETGNDAIDDVAAEAFPDGAEPTPEEMADFVEVAAPLLQGQLDDLEALSPPEDLQGDVDELLSAAQDALDGMIADPESAFGAENPFEDADALAIDLGLTDCAGA